MKHREKLWQPHWFAFDVAQEPKSSAAIHAVVNEKSAAGALQCNDAADRALSFPKPGQSTGVP
jgi:hypothetical protein